MATHQQQGYDSGPGSSRRTLLIVDDEQSILDLLQNILEDAGYVVLTARDGYAALALARQLRPDLVLTDVMMPRMDGRALFAQLRGDADTTRIPVIGMSAVPQGVTDNAFAAFLAKPFDLEQVLRCVYEALSRV
jgi:two-component system alkaline phosphatase synthesis response regulator PhoP